MTGQHRYDGTGVGAGKSWCECIWSRLDVEFVFLELDWKRASLTALHQAQGILVLLHSDAGLPIITPPNYFLAVECSVAWLDLLDAIPADILLLGCNTGEISRQTLSFSSQAQQIHSKKLLCSASRVYTAVQSLY